MEYGDKFKKAFFGGFNREDVLRCIEEMNARNAEELESVKKELSDAKKEAAALTEKVRCLEEDKISRETQLTETSAELENVRQEKEAAQLQLEQLRKEMQSLKALNSELSVKRGILEENNRTLKKKVEELEAKTSEEKAGLEISEMILEAKKTADNIIARANEKAAAVESVIQGQTAAMDGKMEALRGRLSEMRESFRRYADEVGSHLGDMEKQANHAMEETEKPAGQNENNTPSAEEKDGREKNPYSFLFRK
ncbi:MAG: hypothetical protein ACOX6P_00790 [Candidatus Merdivicinus sp.]|jgi:chromosome segregation ATPase